MKRNSIKMFPNQFNMANALNKNTGELVIKVSDVGDGIIEIWRMTITIQDGHPILFTMLKFNYYFLIRFNRMKKTHMSAIFWPTL